MAGGPSCFLMYLGYFVVPRRVSWCFIVSFDISFSHCVSLCWVSRYVVNMSILGCAKYDTCSESFKNGICPLLENLKTMLRITPIWVVQFIHNYLKIHFWGDDLKACSESFTNCTEHPTLDDPTACMFTVLNTGNKKWIVFHAL